MDKATNSRRRGAKLGLLMVLLLALGAAGYALSSSPSASTGANGKSSDTSSAQVLAPAASNTNNGNGAGGNDNCVEPSNGNGNCAKTFGVTVGSTPLLYPGLQRSLPVTFSNPNSFDILVTTYTVSVAVPSSKSAACPASSLQVPTGSVTANLAAAKKGSVATTVPIKLPANASGGCQNVPFSITVNASAVKK